MAVQNMPIVRGNAVGKLQNKLLCLILKITIKTSNIGNHSTNLSLHFY